MKFRVILFLFLFGIAFTSCKKEDVNLGNDEEVELLNGEVRLKGIWKNAAGTATYTGDDQRAYLKETTHNAWLSAIKGGYVKYGDAYIKNLKKKDADSYDCDILWYRRNNGEVVEVRYSSKSTITFSKDGKKVSIRSFGPWDDELATTELFKQL